MKITFVCRHNRFRSKVAEAYFKKINKNKKIKIASVGLIKGFPVAKNVIEIGKKFGMKIKRKTNYFPEDLLVNSDLIVIVANDIPISLFDRAKKVVVWKIPDASQRDKKAIEKRMKLIMKKVQELIKNLEKIK